MNEREVGKQRFVATKQTKDPDMPSNYDNSNMNELYGRKQIIIDVTKEEFLADPIGVIEDNLDTILSIHNQNVKEINYLINYHKGKQDILKKERANGDTKINNKHVTNYAWEFVNFKKGYYVGKPIKYVDLSEEETSDIKYLNRYNKYIRKASKDLVKYENMLITGIAYTMTIPARNNIDNEWQSPYEYYVIDNTEVCVVRSSDIFKTKLFSMFVSENHRDDDGSYSIYTIYYDNVYLVLKKSSKGLELIEQGLMPVYDCITEYQLNEQRMGVFEPIILALNSLNMMTSNQLDQLEEIVNSYLTFENVDVSSLLNSIDDLRAKRILVVNTNNPSTPAKIGVVTIQNDNTSLNEKYKEIEQRSYDIVGVPMPTSNTGQGVSGEAQVYGGGWENAQIIAGLDTQYILKYEYEDLEKFITISKNAINSKTVNLIPTNIEIKYTINKSNNMMVKAQSMKYFIDNGFTREQALTYAEITDDPQTDGNIADENEKKKKIDEINYEVEKTKKLQEVENAKTN